MEEIKAVVSEKLECENPDKSKLIAVFGKSGRSETEHMDGNEWFSVQILLYTCEVFHSGPDGRNHSSSC